MTDLENALGMEIDHDAFWRTVNSYCENKRWKLSRMITLKLRYWPNGSKKATLQEIADMYGLKSRERVRQILAQALLTMRHPQQAQHFRKKE